MPDDPVGSPVWWPHDCGEWGKGPGCGFGLLVILLLVAGGTMVLDVGSGRSSSGVLGCHLAAGIDPNYGTDAHALFTIAIQRAAFDACSAQHQNLPPGWLMFAWPTLIITMACALLWALSKWKARRVESCH